MIDLSLSRQEDGRFDISLEQTTTATIEASIILSLFTNARDGDQYGFWGDTGLGSLLWTLGRQKATTDALGAVKKYCEDALAWMVEEGLAETVSVDATRVNVQELRITVTVDSAVYRYKVGV